VSCARKKFRGGVEAGDVSGLLISGEESHAESTRANTSDVVGGSLAVTREIASAMRKMTGHREDPLWRQ